MSNAHQLTPRFTWTGASPVYTWTFTLNCSCPGQPPPGEGHTFVPPPVAGSVTEWSDPDNLYCPKAYMAACSKSSFTMKYTVRGHNFQKNETVCLG